MNRYCIACGKQLALDSVACSNCGHKVDPSGGLSNMKKWLNSLSGWYRLFFVYACTHFIIVIATCSSKSHGYWRKHYYGYSDLGQYATYVFLHGILPIGGIFLLCLATRWAIKGFSEERPLAKRKETVDTFEVNRRKVNEKKLEKTETKRKDIYKYKKADTFIFFGIITVIIFSTLVITGTLEKLGLNVNLRDNEFVTRWKELVMQSGAVTEKELSETAIQEQELAKLASQDSEMTEQLSTKTTGTYGSLDTMLETVRKEKREKKELDKSLEELKKKKNLEMLKNQRERIGVIVDDIRKYEEIVSSEYGQEMKDTAWQNLISLYTDARDIPLGDIVGFKRIYGISYEISRSFGRNLSVSQIQSMPNLEMINIDTDGSWVSVYSTVEHDYVKKLIEGDHVVVDHATGLMWYRGDQAVTRGKKEWDEAKECVWGMNAKGGYAGYQDWRLPTVEEAASLLSIEDPCFAIKGLGLFLSSIWTADRYDSKSVWVVSCGGVISLRDRWKSQTNNFIDIFPVRLIMKQDKEDTKE